MYYSTIEVIHAKYDQMFFNKIRNKYILSTFFDKKKCNVDNIILHTIFYLLGPCSFRSDITI